MGNRLEARHRLNSWKEIASFFQRDERTVKRWETSRGLPVQRVPGAARCKVYADTLALRDWLRQDPRSLSSTGRAIEGTTIPPCFVTDAPPHPVAAMASPRRLSGWKEIAAFFERDECTVKRWEAKRGLPVHRAPGRSRSRVHADAHELSSWLSSSAPDGPHERLSQVARARADERADHAHGARHDDGCHVTAERVARATRGGASMMEEPRRWPAFS